MMSGVSRSLACATVEIIVANKRLGWTSTDGREFGIVCEMDGSAFVEVLNDGSLVYLGRLPSESGNSMWRDAKVVGDHAVIVS